MMRVVIKEKDVVGFLLQLETQKTWAAKKIFMANWLHQLNVWVENLSDKPNKPKP